MKLPTWIVWLLLPLLAACASDSSGGVWLVTAGEHEITSGMTQQSTVVLFDGVVHLEEGATIADSVFILRGSLESAGHIIGSVEVLGGTLKLLPTAVVDGDVSSGVGALEIDPQAQVRGEIRRTTTLTVPNRVLGTGSETTDSILWFLVQTIPLIIFSYLLARTMPRRLERVCDAILQQPMVCGAFGVLAALVALVAIVVMAFTVILIPVALLVLVFGVIAAGYAWSAYGTLLGKLLAPYLPLKSRYSLITLLGTFAFVLVMTAIQIVPVIGSALVIAMAGTGIGAVLITRLGTQRYVARSD